MTLARLPEVSWEFTQWVYLCFVDLEKAFKRFPLCFFWEWCGSMWCRTRYNGLSGLCTSVERTVFAFSALSQRHSRWMLASASAALCNPPSSWFSQAGYLGGGWITSALGSSGSPLCCLQMMLYCWPPRTVTSDIHCTVFQPSVKQRGWESAPPNLRPWCSARNRWIDLFRWGQSACPKRRISSILESCSRVKVKMEQEIDRHIGVTAAVKQVLHRTILVKRELSIYLSVYVPTLTYDHKLRVVTKRMMSRIQAAKISFLRRVAGHSLRDKVRVSWVGSGI